MFTKQNTKQIKGIAILLMLLHHLAGFPDRIPYGVSLASPFYISGREVVALIGEFGKICVSIFMFLGGYGLYKKAISNTGQPIEGKGLAGEMVNLYKAYWKVFLIFVPIGFLFFANQPQYCANETLCTRFAGWSVESVLMNFVGLSHSLNSEWWFFRYYMVALFEGFVFLELFRNKKNLYLEYGAVIVWTILFLSVFPVLPAMDGLWTLRSNIWYELIFEGSEYIVLFLVGIIFAKYRIFECWKQKLEKLKRLEVLVLSVAAMGLVFYIREFYVTIEFEIVLVPVFIFACHMLIEAVKFIEKPLEFLGKHSTNMWLTHTFYCFYFYQFTKIVYCTNNVVIDYIILLLLSLGTSILLDAFWKLIGKGYLKLRTKLAA